VNSVDKTHPLYGLETFVSTPPPPPCCRPYVRYKPGNYINRDAVISTCMPTRRVTLTF